MESPTQYKIYCSRRTGAGRTRKMAAQFAQYTDAVNWAIDISGTRFRVTQGNTFTVTVEHKGKVMNRIQNGKIQ